MFNENYIITGKIVCETGMHIGGSNEAIEIGGSDNVIIRDSVSDLPFIPGSSIKGKLRTLLELNDKESAKSVIDNKGGPSKYGKASVLFGTSSNEGDSTSTKIQISRVIIRDSFPTEDTLDLWKESDEVIRGSEIKYENTINRITSAATPRNIERIPKGSSFDLEIIVSLYDEDNKEIISTLLESMKLLEDNYLGGSGTRGFGNIKFEDLTIVKRNSDYYKGKSEEEKVELSEFY